MASRHHDRSRLWLLALRLLHRQGHPCLEGDGTARRHGAATGRPAHHRGQAMSATAILTIGCVAGALVALFVQAMGWLR